MSGHMQESIAPNAEVLLQHYEIERELSDRLRNAPSAERRGLYSVVYDEFHRRVTYLNYLNQATDEFARNEPSRGLKLIQRFLTPDSVFLEIGAGDCSLSREVSAFAQKVYAVDVSELAMRKGGALPANVEMQISDGINVPAPVNSIDVAFSSNLIEHLHPDDAFEQARNVYDALKPGGVYICVTPNRLYGPHDISSEFGKPEAVGFHLKEYAYGDIAPLFKQVGFDQIRGYLDLRGRLMTPFPSGIAIAAETIYSRIPRPLRMKLMNPMPIRALLFVRVIARKPRA